MGKYTVDLQGWDVVNLALTGGVDAAIAKQNAAAVADKTGATKRASPAGFDHTGQGMTASLTGGIWGNWRMATGGSGLGIRVDLPVTAGTASFQTPGVPMGLAAKGAAIQLDATGLVASIPATSMPQNLNTAYAATGQSTGRLYFEATLTAQSPAPRPNRPPMVGIGPGGVLNAGLGGGNAGNSFGYQIDGAVQTAGKDNLFTIGGKPANGPAWGVGQTIGVAVDLGAGKLWFRAPNGTWIGDTADPVAGTGPAFNFAVTVPLFPAVSLTTGTSITVNFGATAFANAAPMGYGAWRNPPRTRSVDLTGAIVQAVIQLDQVPDPSGMVHLVPATTTKLGLPAANVQAVVLASGAMADQPVVTAFDDWLVANIGSFTQTFQSVDLSKAASVAPGLAWITPNGFSYAVADGTNAAGNPVSALAILTETAASATVAGMNTLSATVPPNLLAGLPGNCNALVAISAEQMVANILLQGAIKMFKGSSATDFAITGNGHIVTNLTPQELPEQTLDNGDKLTPKIPIGGMSLAVSGHKITVTFDGVTGDLLNGASGVTGLMVTFSFAQSFYLVLHPRNDGTHVLAASFADPDDPTSKDEANVENLSTHIQMTPSARAAQIAILSVGIVLAALSVGAVAFGAKGINFARQADQNAAGAAGTQLQNTGQATVIYSQLPPIGSTAPAIPLWNQAVATTVAGGTAASTAGPLMVFMGKYGVTFATLGAVGLALGLTGSIVGGLLLGDAVHLANGDYDNVDASLTAQKLVDTILANFVWPEGRTFTLVSARLDDALMLYGNLT